MRFKEGGLQLNRTIIFNGINGLEAFDLIVDTVTKEPPARLTTDSQCLFGLEAITWRR